jgi:hypothetical protein
MPLSACETTEADDLARVIDIDSTRNRPTRQRVDKPIEVGYRAIAVQEWMQYAAWRSEEREVTLSIA